MNNLYEIQRTQRCSMCSAFENEYYYKMNDALNIRIVHGLMLHNISLGHLYWVVI